MPEVKKTLEGCVVIDDRFPSVVITSFVGTTDLELGRWFADRHKRLLTQAASEGRKIITINDATLAGRPSAEMRKFWADMSRDVTPSMQTATRATFVVVSNALIRGALTAIGWMSPAIKDLEAFATVDQAILEAKQRLSKVGAPGPLPAVPYQMPDGGVAAGIARSGK